MEGYTCYRVLFMNEEIIMLAGSSFWAPGSWVLSFEKKIQNWKLEM